MLYPLRRDRAILEKPPLPPLGPAGTDYTDQAFGTSVYRVTDSSMQKGRSYTTPSSEQVCAWSADSRLFYVMLRGGWGPQLFSFDPETGQARQGERVAFSSEPTFSQLLPGVMYGTKGRTVARYDCATKAFTTLLDVAALDPEGLPAGQSLGGSVQSSASDPQRVVCFYGGAGAQDKFRRVMVCDIEYPGERWVLDTMDETIDGAKKAGAFGGGITVHAVGIDRSGRYVAIYPAAGWKPDSGVYGFVRTPSNGRYQVYVWDVDAGIISPITWEQDPYGHDAYGFGVRVNKSDNLQWKVRSLVDPTLLAAPAPLILNPPKRTYEGDHPNWNNAKPGQAMPFVTGLFRYGLDATSPWGPWDDELLLVSTMPGEDPWRLCHHRCDVAGDDGSATGFYYQVIPQISPDGQWVLFHSNMEKSLGADTLLTDPTTKFRTDVFLVKCWRPDDRRPAAVIAAYGSAQGSLEALAAAATSQAERDQLAGALAALKAANTASLQAQP